MEQSLNLMLPGNPRYQPKSLQPFFGYDYLVQPFAEIEAATVRTTAECGIISEADIALLTDTIVRQLMAITTTQVDQVERQVTKHDVRAWIRLAQEILPEPLRRWAHVPLTSYDKWESARALMYTRAHTGVVRPTGYRLLSVMATMVERNLTVRQIGRTHGQHALPITVGFWLATILHRALYCMRQMDLYAEQLVGKISGAVGAYNAQAGLKYPADFEERVLAKLGLKPAPISTQILPPEPLAYYLFSCVMLSAALGQFARDCRHLMRSEIGEIREEFESGQVGSSTMAHKRNPINFENTEGMYLRSKNEFGKVLDTMISEHQRDLVGSCVYRDFPTIVVNLVVQLETLLRGNKAGVPFLERLTVDSDVCLRNLDQSAGLVMAEPLYIALHMAGYRGDAHELVNHSLMPIAQSRGVSLLDALSIHNEHDEEALAATQNIPSDVLSLLGTPDQYIGRAVEKSQEIVAAVREYLPK